MITTYQGLIDQAMRLLDATAGETDTTEALVRDALNQAHLQRCTEFPWPFLLWAVEETITTVSGQTVYPLHQEFQRPLYFLNRSTSPPTFLQEVQQRDLVRLLREEAAYTPPSSSVMRFAFVERSPVAAHPASAAVTVVSASALDTGLTAQIAVKGVTTAGDVEAEILTPDGTTPVSGTTLFKRILAVTRAGEWNGVMTLSSGGTTLLALDPTEMGRSYPQIALVETPSAAETIAYRFYRQPLMLVNDYDIPEIPPPHTQILLWDALVAMGAYLTEIPASRFNVWKGKQAEAQLALYQAFANEGNTAESDPPSVRYIDRGETL